MAFLLTHSEIYFQNAKLIISGHRYWWYWSLPNNLSIRHGCTKRQLAGEAEELAAGAHSSWVQFEVNLRKWQMWKTLSDRIMTTQKKSIIIILAFLFCSSVLFLEITGSTVCNEALCASIVSKCTLLKSCECEITPSGCECCAKCFACLEYLQVCQ